MAARWPFSGFDDFLISPRPLSDLKKATKHSTQTPKWLRLARNVQREYVLEVTHFSYYIMYNLYTIYNGSDELTSYGLD